MAGKGDRGGGQMCQILSEKVYQKAQGSRNRDKETQRQGETEEKRESGKVMSAPEDPLE